MHTAVIGWDIGGAHLKAVMLNEVGCVVQATQRVCPLWQGLEQLVFAMQQVLSDWQINASNYTHALTMTGELVDVFSHRAQGVMAIAHTVQPLLEHCFFYSANAAKTEFVTDVTGLSKQIASMNWHASALCIAQQTQGASIVMDIGSTTTDITACEDGRVITRGWTDAERMAQGGLFYSGVVRTALMAFGPYLDWQAKPYHLAAEYFATTADVYRLLGHLSKEEDIVPTADGQDRSQIATMRRLARMVGHDMEDFPESTWYALAEAFKQQQMKMISQLISPLLVRSAAKPTLISLGAGQFLVEALAHQLGLAVQSAQSMINANNVDLQRQAAIAYPAFAVARLWQQWH